MTNSQTSRGKDVALLSIPIMELSNMGRTVWVIFYSSNLRSNTVLVAAEVYQTIPSFMATAPVKDSKSPSIIPPTTLMEGRQ